MKKINKMIEKIHDIRKDILEEEGIAIGGLYNSSDLGRDAQIAFQILTLMESVLKEGVDR